MGYIMHDLYVLYLLDGIFSLAHLHEHHQQYTYGVYVGVSTMNDYIALLTAPRIYTMAMGCNRYATHLHSYRCVGEHQQSPAVFFVVF